MHRSSAPYPLPKTCRRRRPAARQSRAAQIDQTGRLKSSPQMQRPVALQAVRIQFGQMSAGHVERGKGAIAQHDILFKGAMDQPQRHRQGLALQDPAFR